MAKLVKLVFISSIFLSLVGCQGLWFSEKISLENDAILIDLQKEVENLDEELSIMKDEGIKIIKYLSGTDIEPETERSLKRELSESKKWQKKIFEHSAFYQIKIKKRVKLLNNRNSDKVDYSKVIIQEENDYFLDKQMNTLDKGWEDRYRAAIDFNP